MCFEHIPLPPKVPYRGMFATLSSAAQHLFENFAETLQSVPGPIFAIKAMSAFADRCPVADIPDATQKRTFPHPQLVFTVAVGRR